MYLRFRSQSHNLSVPGSSGGNNLIGGGDATATHMLDAFLIRQAAKCGLHSQGGNDHAAVGMKSPMEPSLWTMRDVARYLCCTSRHVQNLVTSGLPHVKVGRLIRFIPEEVRCHLMSKRVVRGR